MKSTYGMLADIDLSLFIRLSRCTQRIQREIQKVFSEYDLSLSQFAVLEILYHKGALSTGEIVKSILTTGGNITVVLRNLEKKGLIQTCEAENDRRIRLSALTKEGEQLVESVFPVHLERIQSVLGVLTPEEKQTVTKLLFRIERPESVQEEL